MSNHQHSPNEDIPRFEPWLAVMGSSLFPPLIALFVDHRFLIPSIVATVVLFLAGVLMLRRQTVWRRLEQQKRPLPGARSVARSFDGEAFEMEGAEP
jgi:hypothetical protein